MAQASGKEVPLDNDYEFEAKLTRKNTTSGQLEAAAGLAGLFFWFSATDQGAEINAAVKKAATERSGAAGVYFAIAEGNDLRTYLASIGDGGAVFEVFGDGTNVYTSIQRVVRTPRRPT